MFNALRYSRELEAAGFTRQQAEATINAFYQFMEHSFASKDDFMSLKGEVAAFRSEFKADLAKLETRMDHLFVVQRKSMLLHLYLLQGASVAFVVAAFFGIVKLVL